NDRNGVLAETGRVDRNFAGGEQLDVMVVAADKGEEDNCQGNESPPNPELPQRSKAAIAALHTRS
ncbi:MAG: hypothetical protein WBX03_00830, partial [Terriglobales bacterium]